MYRMLRVFCATAWELEGERRAFYDVLGEFNEAEAMKQGVLYVPVSLTNVRDKRPYQYVVEENIRDSRAYILAVSDSSWGPPERNFERDMALAAQYSADPNLPMRYIAVLHRAPSSPPSPLPESVRVAPFSTTDDFSQGVRGLLSNWLARETELAAG